MFPNIWIFYKLVDLLIRSNQGLRSNWPPKTHPARRVGLAPWKEWCDSGMMGSGITVTTSRFLKTNVFFVKRKKYSEWKVF